MAEPASTAATAAATAAISVASGLGAALGVSMIDTVSVAVFGVPTIVALFAFLGSMSGMVYGDPIRPWVHMIFVLLANTLLGIVGALAAPHVPGFGWLDAMPKQAIAFSISFAALWLLPVLAAKAGPALSAYIDRVLGRNRAGRSGEE